MVLRVSNTCVSYRIAGIREFRKPDWADLAMIRRTPSPTSVFHSRLLIKTVWQRCPQLIRNLFLPNVFCHGGEMMGRGSSSPLSTSFTSFTSAQLTRWKFSPGTFRLFSAEKQLKNVIWCNLTMIGDTQLFTGDRHWHNSLPEISQPSCYFYRGRRQRGT